MKKAVLLSFCMMLVVSSAMASFADLGRNHNVIVKTTDMPDYPDNDGGPFTDPDTGNDSGPDSTDSGDSWDSGSDDGFADPDGSGGGVLF